MVLGNVLTVRNSLKKHQEGFWPPPWPLQAYLQNLQKPLPCPEASNGANVKRVIRASPASAQKEKMLHKAGSLAEVPGVF